MANQPLWETRYPYPTADGSFIQTWLVRGWTVENWLSELQILKEADMTYLILAPSVVCSLEKGAHAIYPSKIPWILPSLNQEDTIENCLKACKKLGMKVFLGLNEDNHWWHMTEADRPWFITEMHRGNEIACEIYSRYKERYPETFYGWYWVWELSSLHLKTPMYQDSFAEALNIQLDYLTKLDATMPLMLCPYMVDTISTPEESYLAWNNFFRHAHFRPGDIFCPQDAVGAGWLKLDNFVEYFTALKKAVEKVDGLLFWSDAETFRQEDWTSTTMDRFALQLKLSSHLIDNYITFAYCHYFSPYIVPKGYHLAYLDYLKTGEVKKAEVIGPSNTNWSYSGETLHISWRKQDIDTICGYIIYQDGIYKTRLQPKPSRGTEYSLPDCYKEIVSTLKEATYELIAYDYNGNKAQPVKVKVHS